ncbi:MAG TPA: hypothetical protein VK204_07095 [Nocardioidaceae bacterium]|nr:hypothetical protein [Nocardioidaceae bacterium]
MPAPLRGRSRVAAGFTAVTAALASAAAVVSLNPVTTPADTATAQPVGRATGVIVAPQTTLSPGTAVVREGAMAEGGLASARTTTSSGYVLGVSGLLGETPAGLRVWVRRSAPHRAVLARNAKVTVALWKKLGLKATYKGYGAPRLREGVILVTEARSGCAGGHAGITWHTSMPLPHNKAYMQSARVVICPQLFRYAKWQWSATVRHELGHAAGLGHFDGRYKGSTQVMRSVNHAPVSTFKAGDINGLKYFASNNNRVRNAIPPHGRLEATMPAGTDKVRLVGWAMLDWYKAKPVRIVVTDNGKQVASVDTTVYRPDINTLYDRGTDHKHGFSVQVPDPLGSGPHEFCVTAVSPVLSSTTAKLGCALYK